MDRPYDINEERIRQVTRILDTLPRISARIEQINAALFKGGITAAEFRSLANERSGLVKQYDDMQREAKKTYGLLLEKEREDIEITPNNDFLLTR